MERYIIIHYGEIGLKMSNKDYFVNKLVKRIKTVLEKKFKLTFVVKHVLSRIMVRLPREFDEEKYAVLIGRVFGIKNFRFVYEGCVDVEGLGAQIWENMPTELLEKAEHFCVRVKRAMILPFKSFDAERELGALLLDKGLDRRVRLKNPDMQIDVEYFNEHGYFSYKKYTGAGGLSPNSQGKLVCLMSSGIDSPVAAYRMMRRGVRVIFVHFHAYPYSDKEEMEQVQDLVEILSDYQFDTKLYLVPFGEFQKAVSSCSDIPGKIRTVLYRRMMLRIAEAIGKKDSAYGLITGDSLGQVASQTPENMFAIHAASKFPLYQPLIGYDKEEVINISKAIGAFEVSKLACKDSCSMFMPKVPEVRADIYDVEKYEKSLPISEWIEKALKESEVSYFD